MAADAQQKVTAGAACPHRFQVGADGEPAVLGGDMARTVPDNKRFSVPSNIGPPFRHADFAPSTKGNVHHARFPNPDFGWIIPWKSYMPDGLPTWPAPPTTPRSLLAWQAATRHQSGGNVGHCGHAHHPASRPGPCCTRPGSGAHRRRKMAGRDRLGSGHAPCTCCDPPRPAPRGTLLVFHGHNPSVQTILGNYPSEEERMQAEGARRQLRPTVGRSRLSGVFGGTAGLRRTAKRHAGAGHSQLMPAPVVLLPDAGPHHGWGTVPSTAGSHWTSWPPWTIRCPATSASPATPAAARPHSGWLAAIDERLAVAVPGCYFCGFKASLMDIRHCECNYVPGSAGRFDMGDLAALIAPETAPVHSGNHGSDIPDRRLPGGIRTDPKGLRTP